MNNVVIKSPWVIGNLSLRPKCVVQISIVAYEHEKGLPARFCAGLIPAAEVSKQLQAIGFESVVRVIDPTPIASYCNGWQKSTQFRDVIASFFGSKTPFFFDESEQLQNGALEVLREIGGAVGTDIDTITVTNSAALTFSAAVNITGAFSQTNAATGTTTFSSTLAAGSASFNGTTINLGGITTISGNLTIAAGTLDVTVGNFALNVSGTWLNSGTFTARSGTVTFNGTTTGYTINPGASSFYNLTFNGSGGEWSPLTNTVTVTNDLTMTAGTFDTANGTANVTVNGNVACGASCGTISMTATNTFTQNVASNKNFGTSVAGTTAWTFNNLTFTKSTGTPTITTSSTGTGDITVNSVLTIAASTTLDAGNRMWHFAGTGSPFLVNTIGSTAYGSLTANTSTFSFEGTSGTIVIASATYYNLQTSPASGTVTYTLGTSYTCGGAQPCFLAGTQILISEGNTKNIEDLQIGDSVLSYDMNTHQPASSYVTEVINRTADHYYLVNDKVKATANHVFILADYSQKSVADLKIGDVLITYSGSGTEPIETIERIDQPTVVYDIEVAGYHLFYANGYLVHNSVCINEVIVGNNFTLAGAGAGTVNVNTVSPSLTITGNLNIGASQTFITGLQTFYINGNFTNSGTFTAGTGQVIFGGTGTQTINSGGSSFYNVYVTNNTFTLLTNAMTVGGYLRIADGKTPVITATTNEAFTVTGITDGTTSGSAETLTVNTAGAVTFTGAVGTGVSTSLTTLTITNSAALLFSSTVNITGALTQTNAATGTTTFSGALSAGSATFRGTTINLGGTTTISGNLNIATGTLTAGANAVNVSGNWTNSGTFTSTGTVTLNGTNQSLTGSTTFYNLSKTDTTNNSTDAILTFDNTATQTIGIGGLLTLQGIDDNDRVNLVSDSPGTRWELTANGTFAINYADATDSDASGGSLVTFTNTLGNGQNNLNWAFNVTPNVPTLVSPVNGSTATDNTPTLSANYSDPDAGDVGTTNYRISSSGLADCTNNTNVVASGSSDATPDNNENTTWTNGSSIGSSATYYWCTQNDDGVTTSSWTQMGNFILDTTTPDIVAIDAGASSSDRTSLISDTWFKYSDTGSDDQLSFSWTDPSSVSDDTFYYELNASSGSTITGDESTTANPYIDSITVAEGKNYFHVRPKNGAGTWGTEQTFIVKYDKTAPTNIGISSITADLTTQLTIIADTATDGGADLDATPYQFQETSGNDGATSSGWQASATHTDTELSPNTQYTYKIRAKDSLENTSDYSSTSSKYTLANVPGTPTLTVDSASQITVTLTADSNPLGTEYLITNTTNSDANSGWTADASWISSGLTCNTEYTFTVKARNSGAETETSSAVSATTSACPSSGGGSYVAGAFLPPASPLNGFQILINGGSLTTNNQDVNLTIRGSNDTPRMSLSNDTSFTDAVQEPYQITKQWKLSDGYGQKTVYIKFFTAYGVPSNTITVTINYQRPSILNPIINIINPPTQTPLPTIEPIPPQPPVQEVVKPEAPELMSGVWNILPTKAINNFVLSPLPQEIGELIGKFPQLAKTLNDIGISKITDVGKLAGNNLVLPNISQIVGLIGPNMEAGTLAGIDSVSLESLTPALKDKIPTEILFVRASDGSVDYNSTISFNEQGSLRQQIESVVNQTVQIVIRTDNSAKAIKGYLIFKQNTMKPVAKETASKFTASLSGQLVNAGLAQQPSELKSALVLSIFDFVDPDKDGIWTADIATPAVDGRYEILTVIDYQDQRLQPKELTMVVVVDPEGYVYRKNGNEETRITNARVSIYWFNPETGKHELWPAKDYQQVNPQITDNTGRYSFLVPEGTYYLEVKATGYLDYRSDDFKVQTNNGIHFNIELKRRNWWLRIPVWETTITVLIIIILVFLALVFFKSKKLKT